MSYQKQSREIQSPNPNQENQCNLLTELASLCKFHYERCVEYANFIDFNQINIKELKRLSDVPFLPVRIFKELDLLSIPVDKVFRVMTSSGTTGQRPSKIFLDKETGKSQQLALSSIMKNFFGGENRLPMLIIDSPDSIGARNAFSARGAGIKGFSMFGRKPKFALTSDFKLNLEEIENFCLANSDRPVFIFGFTFLIWKHFVQELKKINKKIDLKHVYLLHGGGWKKLVDEQVEPAEFERELASCFDGVESISDYYGMVEQTGSIYLECSAGYLHSSAFSDIIIRDTYNFSELGSGEVGLIQTVSILPRSYPGH